MKAHRCLSLFAALTLLLALWQPATACVGRTLYIGALNTMQEKVMAELLVLLINERTGTTVKLRLFDNDDQLYQAMRKESEEERVDIIVEDTKDAAAILQTTLAGTPEEQYLAAKKAYEQKLDIIWLNPFGYTNGKGLDFATTSAPLVRRGVLTNFPLLPRVLNKLSGAIDNATFTALRTDTDNGAKPKNVAKDFLRAKKFI